MLYSPEQHELISAALIASSTKIKTSLAGSQNFLHSFLNELLDGAADQVCRNPDNSV